MDRHINKLTKCILSFPRKRESKPGRLNQSERFGIPAFTGMTITGLSRKWNGVFAMVFLLLTVTLIGCEQVVPTDDLPYVNHLVIKGILIAGQPLDSVSVTHTLPLSVPYDAALASIPDAHVSITVEGRAIPLLYGGNGMFYDPQPDTVQSGKVYRIYVAWNGLHAEASTLVPYEPVVDSFSVLDGGPDTINTYYYPRGQGTYVNPSIILNYGIRSRPTEVYRITSNTLLARRDSQVYNPNGFNSDLSENTGYQYNYVSDILLRQRDASSDGHLWFRERGYKDDSLISVDASFQSYDAPYYDFWVSYGNNQNGDDIFGVTGTNPKWNVTGDGIGIFFGTASTQVSYRVRN